MASRIAIERLFALPYFQKIMSQQAQPLVEMAVNLTLDRQRRQDIDEVITATEVASRFIFHGVLEIAMEVHAEALSDEEVAFLSEAYQHPVFMTLLEHLPLMVPRVVSWFEENQSTIEASIEAALENP